MDKVFVVEDESVIRTGLRRLLKRNGYGMSEAGSVLDAQKAHSLEDFDLVSSDLRLPDAPGTDLIKLAGDVPVLSMTSYASLRSAIDSMKIGAVDYISKPFEHEEILGSIKRVIEDNTKQSNKDRQNKRPS